MTSAIYTDFRDGLPPALAPLIMGHGRIEQDTGIRFVVDPTPARQYSDAQISDYGGRARRAYPWSPPLRLSVRAWASHSVDQMRGTAGFGLWNQPYMPGQRWPRLPRAIWFFFAGAPSNMALAQGVPGWGWKASMLDATRPAFLALTPTAPLGVLLMRNPTLYRTFYPLAQRALGVAEAPLAVDWRIPHTYTFEWQRQSATFRVDDHVVLQAPYAPRGPLGFIAWIDNQYAIVTPQGTLGGGVTPILESQWLHLDEMRIESLTVLQN